MHINIFNKLLLCPYVIIKITRSAPSPYHP